MRIRVGVLLAMLIVTCAPPASAAARPERVVVIALPGVMWSDFLEAEVPHLTALMPSIAALSARTASRAPDRERGYLTLGAGNAAYVPKDDPETHFAFEAEDTFESGTALDAFRRRSGVGRRAGIVHVGAARLQEFQDSRLYGTEIGGLGESLRRANVPRAVVSAADLSLRPEHDQLRRGAVLALMDPAGSIEAGTLNGLLRRSDDAPYGVTTDPGAFARAAGEALQEARVVLLDPGETSRADEYTTVVRRDRMAVTRREALERTDVIVGRLRRHLTERDMVVVLAPTGPTGSAFLEHLVPMGAWGRRPTGASFGRSWLTSPTTGRQGMVVLADVAPMILAAMGADEPDTMNGTPITEGNARDDGIASLVELDTASSVRERFAAAAFWVVAILFSVLAIFAFIAFLGHRPMYRVLVAVAYFGLAIFPAAHIIRVFEYWTVGVLGSHLLLYGVAAAIAAVVWLLPGPRWAGGVALLLLTVVLFGGDVAAGGPLQVNGVFGHSPLVAGRFYGVSNPGYTILFSAMLLGVTGLVELRGERRLPVWAIIACVALLPLIGLPSMGADFGGLLAGVPAVGVTVALGRGWRIRWRTVAGFAVAATGAAVGLSFLDRMRPDDQQTHLGRFADLLVSGDAGQLGTLITRKAAAALMSLTVTRWTYFIPVGVAVLVLLLLRPRGVLRQVLPQRPLLRAGLWGTLVAGVLGFAVNDSGISIPALALAFTVPFLVLVAVDTVAPRKPAPP